MILSLVLFMARPAGADGELPLRWEVTIAVRLTGGTGKPTTIRLATPVETTTQRVDKIDVRARGFRSKIVGNGDYPHVLLSGRLKGSRRVAASYYVERKPELESVPTIYSSEGLSSEMVPFVSPAPLFQSRSILVREFLETYAGPILLSERADPLRAIFQVTRRELGHDRRGRSLALDVIRRRQGKRIGIERAFTTFLRCAGIPARFVEGVNLASSTRRKRVFWSEVWWQHRWWPVSASQGWVGKLPANQLALARDGTRVLKVEGAVSASYTLQARRLPRDE